MTTSPNPSPQPDYHLPSSWASCGLNEEQYVELMRHCIPLIARVGTSLDERLLRDLAAAAHISPVAELLQDSKRLYEEGLRFSFAQLWPGEDSQDGEDSDGLSDLIPVDALRSFVIATYRRFQAHPDALRLIISENLFTTANIASRVGVLEPSPVVLQLDRLLMRGHDVGAFRDGVSAEDLYILIMSLSAFPVASGSTFHSLYGMNPTDETNSVGMEALVADTVVAFLTTSMPTTQGSSYTHSSLSPGMGPSVAARLYSMEHLPSTVSRGVSSSTPPRDTDNDPGDDSKGERSQDMYASQGDED